MTNNFCLSTLHIQNAIPLLGATTTGFEVAILWHAVVLSQLFILKVYTPGIDML